RFPSAPPLGPEFRMGRALPARRGAADTVGLFDEDFFMFSEETDWCYRFRQAGWSGWVFPGAAGVHVGGAAHGGRLVGEQRRGAGEAAGARRWLLAGVRLRLLIFRGERRNGYREAARWLSSGT